MVLHQLGAILAKGAILKGFGNRYMIGQLGANAMYEWKTLSRIARAYLLSMLGILTLYLASPTISYFIFWGNLPRFSLATIHGLLLMLALSLRLLLLLTGQLNFRSSQHAVGYALLIWVSILQFVWLPALQVQVSTEDLLATVALTFVGAWVVWLGAEALAYLVEKQRSRLSQCALLAAYLSLSLAILHGVFKGYRLYGILIFAFHDPVSRNVYNYLALADALSVVSLLLLGIPSGRTLRRSFFLYVITLFLLLFAYSRASFFGFAFAGIVLLSLRYWPQHKQKFLLGLLAAGTAALIAFISWPILHQMEGSWIEKGRLILERISTPFAGSDQSLQGRLELLGQTLHLLNQHWLLGHFMKEVVETGRGTYAHNWLSFWLAYGIGPFVLSLWLLLSLTARSWYQQRRNHVALLAFCLLAFVFLEILFARSYIWPYFWLGLGFAATVFSNKNRQRRLRP